jgi:hypothetical protein
LCDSLDKQQAYVPAVLSLSESAWSGR